MNCRLSSRRLLYIVKPQTLPTRCRNAPKSRFFTQNGQLLLVTSTGIPRPQLPFLHNATNRIPSHIMPGRILFMRYMTTERRSWLKAQSRLFLKGTVYFWLIVGLGTFAIWLIDQEVLERKYPTPPDWGFWTRILMHDSLVREHDNDGIVNWVEIRQRKLDLIQRLEDPSKDGAQLFEQEEGGILIPGVGKAGFDISAKSDEWRQGYFDCLMTAARAAEQLDGFVHDTVLNRAFPPQFVIGPSNPNAKALPNGMVPPQEENCVPAFEQPDEYYIKILTTKGFTNAQKLAAALGFAGWFEYKGLLDSAEEMYRWGMDVATTGISEPGKLVDRATGVISETAPSVTRNIITASTAFAIHKASQSDVSTALPIFLSVLRARRSAPTGPDPPIPSSDVVPSRLFVFFTTPEFITEPSGDEPLVRTSYSKCDDAEIMNYIGEILFATGKTSAQRLTGLTWTRDAVDLAEPLALDREKAIPAKDRKRCNKCADAGLSNWASMASNLAHEGQSGEDGKISSVLKWFGKRSSDPEAMRQQWQMEEREIQKRLTQLRQVRVMEELWTRPRNDTGIWI